MFLVVIAMIPRAVIFILRVAAFILWLPRMWEPMGHTMAVHLELQNACNAGCVSYLKLIAFHHREVFMLFLKATI
jgi:hypothetical protein